jgi:hypothetical protein
MERIWGPVNGFYVAAYAAEAGPDGRWVSYAKVCPKQPDNYWEADCLFKVFGGDDFGSPEAALVHARLAANAQIARIPPLDGSTLGFAMKDDRNQVVFPLAVAIRRAVRHRVV